MQCYEAGISFPEFEVITGQAVTRIDSSVRDAINAALKEWMIEVPCVDIASAARLLDKTQAEIRDLISDGLLDPYPFGGQMWVSRASVDALRQ